MKHAITWIMNWLAACLFVSPIAGLLFYGLMAWAGVFRPLPQLIGG